MTRRVTDARRYFDFSCNLASISPPILQNFSRGRSDLRDDHTPAEAQCTGVHSDATAITVRIYYYLPSVHRTVPTKGCMARQDDGWDVTGAGDRTATSHRTSDGDRRKTCLKHLSDCKNEQTREGTSDRSINRVRCRSGKRAAAVLLCAREWELVTGRGRA